MNLSHLTSLAVLLALCAPAAAVDKLTYHQDRQRTGWNSQEKLLTPQSLTSGRFGQLWQTPQLDSVNGQAPRLFATPLYVDRVRLSAGKHAGKTLSVIYAATDVGYLYAINAKAAAGVPAGAILWKRRLGEAQPARGDLSTPVIDLTSQRIYTVAGDGDKPWRAHALDLRSGEPLPGWPVAIDAAAVNAPGINRNGSIQFPNWPLIQRGALNLSPSGSRLYVAFGGSGSSGWLVALDTAAARVATAFSTAANPGETQGGMWGSAGASVDKEGHVHIASGSDVNVHLKKLGLPGIFPDSEHNWGQSVIRLRDDDKTGFELVGTYTPFNYAQAQVMDIDLGSSGTVVIDLEPAATSTPQLLLLAGTKQGNAYLLDRSRMPGSLVKRPPISHDSTTDGSLLAPDIQPQFGQRGPLNVFGPYADDNAMNDQARSRTTAAYFRSAAGKHYAFTSGSAKTGNKLETSVPPGLARLEIVTAPGQPAHLRIDQLEMTHTFQNPGSAVVSSDGGRGAIVWVLDTNARRTAPMQGPDAARPVLYAFDALTLALLWKSAPDELATTGKYNEATVVDGMVIVGTDRIQAFGLRTAKRAPVFAPLFQAAAAAPAKPVDPAQQRIGKALFEQRCAACHSTGMAGVPGQDKLAKLAPAHIVDTLRRGIMQPQASGLKTAELDALAAYLTHRRARP